MGKAKYGRHVFQDTAPHRKTRIVLTTMAKDTAMAVDCRKIGGTITGEIIAAKILVVQSDGTDSCKSVEMLPSIR